MSDEDLSEIAALIHLPDRKEVIRLFGPIPFNCVLSSCDQAVSFMFNRATTVHVGVSDFPLVKDVAKKRVYLVAMVQPNGLPIVDVLTSERRHGNMSHCLARGTKIIVNMKKKFNFKYIVVDWNFDVIAETCDGLAKETLLDFLEELYESMMKRKKQEMPSIQVCRAQLMEAMNRRLEGLPSEVRTVATRLFYRLSECASLREAEEWFRHVIILFASKHASSQVEASLNAASTCSDPMTPTVSHTKPDNDADVSNEWEQSVKESPFNKHFNRIRIKQERSMACDESKPLNALHNPGVLKHFDYFIPVFPVWCRYLVPANIPLINTPLERRLNYITTELFASQCNLRPSQVVQTLINDNQKLIDTSNLCFRSRGVSLNLPPSQADHPRGSQLAAKNGNGNGHQQCPDVL